MEQFAIFASQIPENGTLVWYAGDKELENIVAQNHSRVNCIPYSEHRSITSNNDTYLVTDNGNVRIGVFGKHNLQNISGAKIICNQLGISDQQFIEAIVSFKGAARRLEVLAATENTTVYRDFAHSPSKLKATTEAVKSQFPDRKLLACMELHTFSSLQKDFLPHYSGSMNKADRAIVFFDPHTISHKKLEAITPEMVKAGFNRPDLEVYTDSDMLFDELRKVDWKDTNLLLMSSGTYSGKDLPAFAVEITTRGKRE